MVDSRNDIGVSWAGGTLALGRALEGCYVNRARGVHVFVPV